MVSLGEKLKMQKRCEKGFYKNIRVVLCKKPLEKTPNIRAIAFARWPILKMVSFGLICGVFPAVFCQSVFLNDVARDFRPVIGFVSQVSDTRCQAVRERNVGP